jgi:hypothetical protein
MRGRLAMLARITTLLALTLGLSLPLTSYAGKTNEDDPTKKGQADQTEAARSNKEDHQLTGQVLEINTLKDPPELKVANVDGIVVVHLLTTDLVEKNALRTGDHVTLVGEKISEVEFDAQEMRVDAHLGENTDNSN